MKSKAKGLLRFFISFELLISICIAIIISAICLLGYLDRFELTTVDMRFKIRGTIPSTKEVVFVDMAEDSIRNIGRWPWSREWHATIISVLSQYNPEAISFDVLFTEPSSKENDDAMADAMKEAGSVYLPFLVEYDKEKVKGVLNPIPLFKESSKGTGFLDVIPDKDGVVRRVPLVIKHGDKYYRHFSFQIVCDYLKVKDEDIIIEPGKRILLKNSARGDIEIPIDDKCQMIINWAGKWVDTFTHYSYYETLLAYKQSLENQKPMIDLDTYKGKLCFIGLTAIGLNDTKPMPFETLYPMVGIHGNIINSIIGKTFMRETSPVVNCIIIFGICILTGLIVYLVRPFFGGMLSGVVLCMYLGTVFYFFKEQGYIVNIVGPALGVLNTYLIVVIYKYITEEKQKKWIKNAFSHYLSPVLIDQIIANPDALALGGVRRELTVLFSDIRSFTTYCESHTAEEVVAILNEYLDAMVKVTIKYNGTIDKFVGDEIMAVYGSPLWVEPKIQAKDAVTTAIEMIKRLNELHEQWATEGRKPLSIGVGVNTGEMITGNMGSTEIFDYTVIGDNVNVGARVEALTRNYDTDIIITESTYDLVKDENFALRELDSIVVKGKTKPVKIFSVDGYKDDTKNK